MHCALVRRDLATKGVNSIESFPGLCVRLVSVIALVTNINIILPNSY